VRSQAGRGQRADLIGDPAVRAVARDWAAGKGIGGEPVAEQLPVAAGDLPVTRLNWSAPGSPPVVLYLIEGGGHGWPGGPQYLPTRVIGPIPRHLDATGILLDMVTAGSLFCLRRVYQVTSRFPPG
jgi:poly(3-hydroxybutyrate) depolymerase